MCGVFCWCVSEWFWVSFSEWFCVMTQVEASDTRFDGVGGWVSRGSPPVGELPVVSRYRSRGFA